MAAPSDFNRRGHILGVPAPGPAGLGHNANVLPPRLAVERTIDIHAASATTQALVEPKEGSSTKPFSLMLARMIRSVPFSYRVL